MKLQWQFLSTPSGHLLLAAAVVLVSASVLIQQRKHRQIAPLPPAATATPPVGPKTFTRRTVPLKLPDPVAPAVPASFVDKLLPPVSPAKPAPVLPLSLAGEKPTAELSAQLLKAPFGRLIPCETVIALQSNRLETPVIGLVTEDVWENGSLLVPRGTEVHAKASLDPSRERIAVTGTWTLVWRTPDQLNGRTVTIQGLALDRDPSPLLDGSAGLRGEIVRTSDHRELRLFAASFLNAGTAALQSTRVATGFAGESLMPLATARNGALAGTSAILREYADQLRQAIARDGFFVRVPAGKPFYLYLTETLDAAPARRNDAPRIPHET